MYFPLLKKFVCGTEEMDQQLRTLAVFLEDPGSDSGTHLRWLPNIFTPAPGNPTPLASLCTLMNAYVHKIQKCEEKKKVCLGIGGPTLVKVLALPLSAEAGVLKATRAFFSLYLKLAVLATELLGSAFP